MVCYENFALFAATFLRTLAITVYTKKAPEWIWIPFASYDATAGYMDTQTHTKTYFNSYISLAKKKDVLLNII